MLGRNDGGSMYMAVYNEVDRYKDCYMYFVVKLFDS